MSRRIYLSLEKKFPQLWLCNPFNSLSQLNSSPFSLLVYPNFHNTETNQLFVHVLFPLSQKKPVRISFSLEKALAWPTYLIMSYFIPSLKKYKSKEAILPIYVWTTYFSLFFPSGKLTIAWITLNYTQNTHN